MRSQPDAPATKRDADLRGRRPIDEARAAPRTEGEVVAEATRESDVTRQIVDIQARITPGGVGGLDRTLLERAERSRMC